MAAAGTQSPKHVAIIMDGNGRWAEARGLPRLAGHKKGVETVREVIKTCPELGIEYLTLYAFSTENWKRPIAEVMGLMKLFRIYLAKETSQLVKQGVRVRFIGERERLDEDIQYMMTDVEEATADNTALTVQIALNYGARDEMTRAVRKISEALLAGDISANEVSEKTLTAYLDTAQVPDPDLVIRTSGEYRISNFLLWQAAYAEFCFVEECWPDFTGAKLVQVVKGFGNRERRYGAVGA